MMTVGSLALSTVKLFADQVKHPTTRIRTCHKKCLWGVLGGVRTLEVPNFNCHGLKHLISFQIAIDCQVNEAALQSDKSG